MAVWYTYPWKPQGEDKTARMERVRGKECVGVSEINETWNKVGEIKLNPGDQRSKEGKIERNKYAKVFQESNTRLAKPKYFFKEGGNKATKMIYREMKRENHTKILKKQRRNQCQKTKQEGRRKIVENPPCKNAKKRITIRSNLFLSTNLTRKFKTSTESQQNFPKHATSFLLNHHDLHSTFHRPKAHLWPAQNRRKPNPKPAKPAQRPL